MNRIQIGVVGLCFGKCMVDEIAIGTARLNVPFKSGAPSNS